MMESSAWVALLRRIPPDQHNTLAIMTTAGIEMNVQDIMRIEEDHLVIRGRQAGTIAMGRVFFIPYHQLAFLCLQREMKEAQIRILYGDAPEAAGPEVEPQTSVPEPAPTETAAAEATPDAPSPPEVKQPLEPPKPGQLKIPRKSGLIERLRARAQAGSTSRPPTTP
jgi:hypothetical protein